MSKHHWAEALAARGNRVLWLDAPGTAPLYGAAQGGPVEHLVQTHWLRGVNRMPIRVQQWYSARAIKRIEAWAGQKVDLVWSFDTTRLLQLPKKGRIVIRHPVDLFMLEAGSSAFADADLLLTTSDAIARPLRQMASTTPLLNLGHGLDSRWTTPYPDKAPRPVDKRPVVACAGNMAIPFLDWEVIHQEVTGHPTVDFRFIGPCTPAPTDPWFKRVAASPNVIFTGFMPLKQLIPELYRADVLLLCYRADLWPQQLSNPHKLLEYLATRNPVVASATSEYEGMPPKLIAMARHRWDHPALLSTVLANLDDWNTADVRAARSSFARSRTIEAQLTRVEQALAPRWQNRS
ncbi:MAG: glycosyltransferase [Flavobacteriales bacterium]|nr:glycosyltransferase [Flavobacteriales bacterium]